MRSCFASLKVGKVWMSMLAVVVSTLLAGCGGHSSGSGTVSLQSLTVTPASLSLAKGTTRQLTVTGTYSDGTSRNVTSQVT